MAERAIHPFRDMFQINLSSRRVGTG